MCKSEMDIAAIQAAKTLIEYCKEHTNSCGDCPFYARNNGEWHGCALGYDIPEMWEIKGI